MTNISSYNIRMDINEKELKKQSRFQTGRERKENKKFGETANVYLLFGNMVSM